MTTITEGKLTFRFPPSCQASQYDEWSFYRESIPVCLRWVQGH